MATWKKVLIGVVAAVALVIGGVYAYIFIFEDDAPAALDEGDLGAALSTPPADTSAPGSSTAPTDGAATTSVDGTWTAVQEGSTLGYRVSEVLGGVDTEGAGRTDQVTGSITISGTQVTEGDFTVDMTTVTSDQSRRDGQFNGRIMSTDQFPTATFVLTEPIDFGKVPAEGETLTATATGDLTLRGVTNSVTFEVQAQLQGGKIGVLGNIPITFSDYDIPDPSNGFAIVKDNGLLEFVLVFEQP